VFRRPHRPEYPASACHYLRVWYLGAGEFITPAGGGKMRPGRGFLVKLLITLVGLVLILEGLPYFAFPETMQRWLRQLTEMPPAFLRMMGLFAIAAGLALCFLARRTGILG
jgi:uncharacterized protein YjeT (DUF2065 family)